MLGMAPARPRLQKATGAAALAQASVLIVDDELGMRHFISRTLENHCKRVMQAASAAEATRLLDQYHFDVVVVDNIMPEKTGLEWVAEQRKVGLFADAILMTAYADVDTAIQALRVGVADFLLKPFRANQLMTALVSAVDRKYLERDNYLLRHALTSDAVVQNNRLMGKSQSIQSVLAMLEKLAPVDTSVLFTGESGTGKEVAARTLHSISDRRDAPFVAVNCAMLLPETIEEHLFGSVTDETGPNDGLMQHADGGVLFFDEVGQLPDQVQAALLRVLEEQKIRPRGAKRDVHLNLRFFFATNAALEEAVAQGRFREDLYHRINVINVEMPRLRERTEDIVELSSLFLTQFSVQMGVPAPELNDENLLKLTRHSWPGNVRELRNLIERSVILGHFPQEFSGTGKVTGRQAVETLELVTQRHILSMLDNCKGNRAEAARRLGVSRKTIDRKLQDWSLVTSH